jgi:tripartite-type tricarboxylate transporter receptor subunit TctC
MNSETRQPSRRTALFFGAALLALHGALAAQPGGGTVRMVVPFAAGGGSDVVARLVADGMREALNETVIVDNLAGAAGNIGADAVARAKPDGRTLLFTPQSPLTIAQFVEPKPPFDPERAFVPIAIVAQTPLVLLVNASVPANSLQELVAYSKANPKALSYGVPSHEFGFTIELLARHAGLSMLGVPYRGSGQAMTDLLGGTIQVLLSSGGAATAQLKDKRVKALAVVGTSRSPQFPDVPSTKEVGLGDLKVFGWFGIFAPAGTPERTLDRLTQAATALAKDPIYAARLKQAGYEPLALDRAQTLTALAEHRNAWRSIAPRLGEK